MKKWKNVRRWISGAAALVLGLLITLPATGAAYAAGLEMSTDYPGLSATAGETLVFSLDFDNSASGCSVSLWTDSIPEGWTGGFTGGGSEISQVYIRSGENPDAASYNLTIPADAADGTYTAVLHAEGGGISDTLTLTVAVTSQELGGSSLVAEYASQEGTTDTSFSFSMTIQNNTASEQTYSLSANTPDGWTIAFQPSGESTQVAAITVDARSSQGLTVTVTPPASAEAQEYAIPISAISGSENLSTELSITILGSYDLSVTASGGLLSFDATANQAKNVTLTVTNLGNVDLQNINLTASVPTGWTAEFSESTIGSLEAGSTAEVTMTVTPSKDALSGDYVTVVTASGDETSATAEFRVTVKTSTLWGIIGILLIAAAAGGLWYVFRKYGRR